MKITYKQIADAVRDQCPQHLYHMELAGEAADVVTEAVNKGIDSHLEACFCPERGDKYEQVNGRLMCEVSPESLPVLLRRLTGMCFCEDSETLACDILGTLEFNTDACDVEIVCTP